MTKKHFIALADKIREHNSFCTSHEWKAMDPANRFTTEQLNTLADFCAAQNPQFNRERWLDYIAGKVGPNGGRVKVTEPEVEYYTDGEGHEVWSG